MFAHAFNNGVVLEILCNVPTYIIVGALNIGRKV